MENRENNLGESDVDWKADRVFTGRPGEGGVALSKEESEKILKATREQEKVRKEKIREEIKIPEDVKPGTVDMVWYGLKRAILLHQEQLREVGGKNKELEEKIAKLEEQKDLLDRAMIANKGKTISEAYDYVQFKIDIIDKQKEDAHDTKGLEVAKRLHERLVDEENRSQPE